MVGGVYMTSRKKILIVHQIVSTMKKIKEIHNLPVCFKNVSTHTHVMEQKIQMRTEIFSIALVKNMTQLKTIWMKHVMNPMDTATLAPINTINQLGVVSVLHA